MTCLCCQTSSGFPGYRMFALKCIHCGARLLQRIRTLPIAASASTARQNAVIKDWTNYGHDKAKLLRLANGPTAIDPDAECMRKR